MFLGKFLEMGEYDKHFYGTSLDRFVSHIFHHMMMIVTVFLRSKRYKQASNYTLLTTIFQYSASSQLREDLCSQLAGLNDHWPYVLVQESKSWII